MYGDNADRKRGIREEPRIKRRVKEELLLKGYILESEDSSLQEDQRKKIDSFLSFNEKTPFFDKLRAAIDVKSGWTLTVENENGEDTLESSKSDYIVFEYREKIFWFEKNILKEWVKQNKDSIKNNRDGGKSKWIGVIGKCPYELRIPEIKTSLKL